MIFRCFSIQFLAALTMASSTYAIDLQVSEAPTTDLQLTVGAIESAKTSLLLNIYELTSPQITDALLARIDAGVQVQILEEGAPVGGLSAAAKGVQAQLAQAMQGKQGDHLYEMKAQSGSKRRYRFDHAKYAVIDGVTLLIGSENYSPSGNPVPGSVGNRGWEVLIQDAGLATEYKNTFVTDADLSAGDVVDLTQNPQGGMQGYGAESPTASVSGIPTVQADSIEKLTSPDTSLSGIVDALNQAKTSIDIEQMTFDSAWKGSTSSPIVDAVVSAAKDRGVRVRVLLNDDHVFDHPGHPAAPKNQTTVDYLNQVATQSNLNMTAKIANLKAMGVDYIHNKGLLIDGNKTLISSINWDENSMQNNREAAVLITGTQVFDHYQALFQSDWIVSGGASAPSNAAIRPSAAPLAGLLPADNSDCPDSINLSLKIGDITVDESSDQDLLTLKNKIVKGEYVRNKNSTSCILSESPPQRGLVSKSFIEIKKSATGALSITYEGYTQKTGKLFSVRSKLAEGENITGKHDAVVYNASSARREKIGTGTFELSL